LKARLKAKPNPSLGRLELARVEGEWVAATPASSLPAVRLTTPEPIVFLGALGQFVPLLGLPQSSERILGSTWRGRYQEFEKGVANWEVVRDKAGEVVRVPGISDAGFPILMGAYSPKRGEDVKALVAFFDYRGFTKWSGNATADRVQSVVMDLEIAFQDAFDPDAGTQVFAKGTGDGFMIVSEANWFDAKKDAIQPAHAKDFANRCRRTVNAAAASLMKRKLGRDLAVGCAITTGTVTRVYILGRFDYLGAAVNYAAKLQGGSWNAVCVDDGLHALLREKGAKRVTANEVSGWQLKARRG
jgi:class 3 adenylate cyclase